MIVGMWVFLPLYSVITFFRNTGWTFIDDGKEERQQRKALNEYLKSIDKEN